MSIIEETTSLILKRYFKNLLKPPMQAPAIIPTIMTRGFAIGEGSLAISYEYTSKNPAVNICPETPILNKPALMQLLLQEKQKA